MNLVDSVRAIIQMNASDERKKAKTKQFMLIERWGIDSDGLIKFAYQTQVVWLPI